MIFFWCFVASACGTIVVFAAGARWGPLAEAAALVALCVGFALTGMVDAMFAVLGLLIGYLIARLWLLWVFR